MLHGVREWEADLDMLFIGDSLIDDMAGGTSSECNGRRVGHRCESQCARDSPACCVWVAPHRGCTSPPPALSEHFPDQIIAIHGIGGQQAWQIVKRVEMGELEHARPKVIGLLIGANDMCLGGEGCMAKKKERTNNPEELCVRYIMTIPRSHV
ncbi:hypothetical protein CYMTET_49419 [Cymbomonas tetramitiformis]|uniref:Uncharacterized protein n=1 Tax=Cymbomonas tetramitiformis TaxID=36881 RepID=A0AAE0BRC6_9CHLO|nr:hypothetical protein CYMTET_49419 [Cymbomonas tetramitiformis]